MRPARRGGCCLAGAGTEQTVDAKGVGQAGLVGWRGRMGRRLADELGRRTRLDAELVAALIGAYPLVSRTRRMLEMLGRLRRAA